MDPGTTPPGDQDEQTHENVVRFPRDWLGPREELVPIGGPARPADEAMPPTAASFWDEDGGSLQAPMQAPAGAWPPPDRARRPTREDSPPREPRGEDPAPRDPRREDSPPRDASHARPRARKRPTMSRLGRRLPLPSLHWPTVRHPARVRAAAALGLIAACALLVIAVIGETEGSAPSSGLQQANVVGSAPQEQTSELERARSATDALLGRKTAPKAKRNHAVKRHANGKRSRIHATPTHHRRPNHRKKQPTHRASAPTHTTSEVVQTTTTYTPTTTSTASQTPVTSNPSAGEAASSSSGSGNARQPAFGLNGSLGPGRSPDS